uniref:Sugar transporter n=1 Tax=Nilaparvata lugens TaxID=108931 RepID=A0A0A8J805_NILLU|nr:sugar transporter [Nilaparvata lugens]
MSQQRQRSRLRLYLAAFSANLSFTSCGCAMAWTSPVLDNLDKSLGMEVSTSSKSWIGSLIAVGAICGPLMANKLLDRVGRRWTLILDVMLLILSWVIVGLPGLRLTFVDPLSLLYFGRFLSGVAVGIIFMSLPVYIAEISDVESRGPLGSLNELFIAFGFFFEYVFGSVTTYLQLAMASTAIPLLFLATFWWMPESPHFLVMRGRKAEALKAIKWIRNYGDDEDAAAEKEAQEIQALLDDTKDQSSPCRDLVMVKGNRRALLISCGLIFAQQFTGINVVQFYTQSILEDSSKPQQASGLPTGVAPMLVGGTQFFSSILTPIATRLFGIKIPLLLSALGAAIGQGALGIYFVLSDMEEGHGSVAFELIPVISMVFFMASFCIGLGPLPWAVMGEMFPPNVKALSSSVVSSFCFLLTFILTKFFKIVSDEYGRHSPIFFFAFCCFFGLIFIALTIPDTRGMTLQEIQDVLNGRTHRCQSPAVRRVTQTGSMIQIIMRSGLLVEQPDHSKNLLASEEEQHPMIPMITDNKHELPAKHTAIYNSKAYKEATKV